MLTFARKRTPSEDLDRAIIQRRKAQQRYISAIRKQRGISRAKSRLRAAERAVARAVSHQEAVRHRDEARRSLFQTLDLWQSIYTKEVPQ